MEEHKIKDSKRKNIKKWFKDTFKFINKKNKFNTMEVIVLMIITLIFGMFAGGLLMYGKGALNTGIRKELNQFIDTYAEILNEYYEDIEEDKLLEAGIKGMINFLGDPYSVYMDLETNAAFQEKVNGEYVGIGVEIIQYTDGKVEVNEAYIDGPAYASGLRKGDELIKVSDKEIKNMSLSEISSLVKGEEGTKVKLTVLRDEEEITFNVLRKKVDISSVTGELIEYNDSKIGYLVLDIFAANTAKQFEKELKKLEKDGIESLVIDVRGNSGGYLTTVTDILSMILKKDTLIYQLKTKEEIEKIYDKTEESRDYKIAVLVNAGSASASEVLTAALKEKHDAYVVGTTTYGKSKVQKTQDLANGTSIKYTFQEWLMPSGESVGDKGITPDYEVIYEKTSDEDSYDNQLTKALELLTEKETEE